MCCSGSQRDLQRPELSFMAKESLELGDAFVDLLNDLRSLSPGGELADEVKLDGRLRISNSVEDFWKSSYLHWVRSCCATMRRTGSR